jgi:fibro-slime domain-containing protein
MKVEEFLKCARPMGVLALIGAAGMLAMPNMPASADSGAGGMYEEMPDTIELTGVVRDFRERTAPNGHTDFEVVPDKGYGHYMGNVSPTLGSDDKPVFTGAGSIVSHPWRDAQGRPICYRLYNASLGDVQGTWGAASKGGIASADSFNSWFRDVAGTNMSAPLTLTLTRQSDGSYVFDDKNDSMYSSLGGFFPIEDQLLGNPGGSPNRNFHFTFELHTEFTYDAHGGQMFKFIGDDDVWVYINGQLVIDLGGVHSAKEQYVDLNRLGLTDGETYALDFFFAERHRTQSNCRIQTNLQLQNQELPAVTAAFD